MENVTLVVLEEGTELIAEGPMTCCTISYADIV